MIAAAAGGPLGAHQLVVLLIVLAGVGILMAGIRVMGEVLAQTHPEPPAKPQRPAPAAPAPQAPARPSVEAVSVAPMAAIDPEVLAAITAAISTVITKPYRILSISSPRKPPVESLMQVWSWEGRRQIYSSHRVR